MSTFDIWIIIILIIFFLRGWHNGTLRSLSGPLALFLWAIFSIICFDDNQNILLSIVIWLTGTVITTAIINVLWFLARRTIPDDHKNYIFWGSRLMGGFLSLGWKGLVLMFLILMASALPSAAPWMQAVKEATLASKTYNITQKKILPFFPSLAKVTAAATVLGNPERLKNAVGEEEYKRLTNNPKIKKVLTSADLRKKINDGNILSLMNDKKIQDVINDKRLSRELGAIAKQLYSKDE